MAAVVNEDVFFSQFSDDDKETNLVELWAQNQCLYETTSEEYKDRSKRSQAYQCLFKFWSKYTCLLLRYAVILNNLLVMRAQRF